jgi:N-acetyl-anhydromuramyl-L-alanine amidase AmpD
MEIIKQHLMAGEYFPVAHTKKQIYLHHTAGNGSAIGVVRDWNTDKRGRIGTAYIIGGGKEDGNIVEAHDPKHWAYHLGIPSKIFREMDIPYQQLDKISIGIEICSWGQLTEKNGQYYNYVNRVVPKEEVCILDKSFKGYRYYHKYSEKQIASTKELLLYLSKEFGIPIKYNEDIFALNTQALSGEPGLYTHNSVRPDKVDVFPQPELIAMLKTL